MYVIGHVALTALDAERGSAGVVQQRCPTRLNVGLPKCSITFSLRHRTCRGLNPLFRWVCH